VAFSSTTTIYPDVSDTRNREKTTIYPYTMSASDVPRRPYDRGRAIQARGSSRDEYATKARAEIAAAGSYAAWLDQLELASPSRQPGAVIGGTAADYKIARRSAQGQYDYALGIFEAGDAQVSVSDDASDLGATLDAIGDQAEGLVERARRNPGATVAIVGGAILLFLLARRR
jgi:hypothetical protein